MSSSVEILLPENCTVMEIAGLHPKMIGALESGEKIVVDGSAVERIDGMALQLLWCLHRDAGRNLHWCGVSEALRTATEWSGMEGLFDGGK